MNWFECRIRYNKMAEDGKDKKITESYLVDALSFTEAEARIIEKMTPYIDGEFQVVGIVPVKYNESFLSDDEVYDKFYKCKIAYITLDDKSDKERRSMVNMLVQSNTTEESQKMLHERMKGTLSDYEIISVSETKILEVFPYVDEKESIDTK